MEEFVSLGPLAAFMASVTWAVGVLGYSKLSDSYPPYIINFYRILVGLPAAILILVFKGEFLSSIDLVTSRTVFWVFVVVMSSYAFGDALFFMAAKMLGAPSALAIASTYPLWSALWGYFVEGEVLSVYKAAGIVVMIAGVIVVILSGAKRADIAPGAPRLQKGLRVRAVLESFSLLGVFLAVATSISWAFNTIAISEMGESLPTSFVNVWRLGLALILCPIVGILMNGKSSFRPIERKVFLPLLPLFLVECILGPFFYVYGLSYSRLAVGSALTALAPAISVPLAVMLGREKFSLMKSMGIVSVVIGVWLLVFN